jgi:hypothetical protein
MMGIPSPLTVILLPRLILTISWTSRIPGVTDQLVRTVYGPVDEVYIVPGPSSEPGQERNGIFAIHRGSVSGGSCKSTPQTVSYGEYPFVELDSVTVEPNE